MAIEVYIYIHLCMDTWYALLYWLYCIQSYVVVVYSLCKVCIHIVNIRLQEKVNWVYTDSSYTLYIIYVLSLYICSMYSYIYIYLETLCMYDFTNRCFKPGWKMEVTRDIFPAQAGDLEAAHKWLPCMLGCSNRTRLDGPCSFRLKALYLYIIHMIGSK